MPASTHPPSPARLVRLVDQRLDEGKQVARVKPGGRRRDAPGDIGVADDLDAIGFDDLAGPCASTLPPRSTARSTSTEPGFMDLTISALTSFGAGRPGISAVVITMSCFLRMLGGERGLLGLVLFRHLLGVAAGGLARSSTPRLRPRGIGPECFPPAPWSRAARQSR